MGYDIDFTQKAIEDIASHKKAGDKILLNKILKLLEELADHPYTGSGKPEPLKYELSGMWSRRINKEHRMVYEVIDDTVFILSIRGHYKS